MSRKKIQQILANSYTDLAAGVAVASQLTGGSQLSGYSTVDYSNNYSLITLNRIVLTYMFTGNAIFQRAIQIPILDAISKGCEIESAEVSNDEIDEVMEWFDTHNGWDIILDAFTWARLYGGGGIIINTEQNPETELEIESLQDQKIRFYDADRWILTTTGSAFNDVENQFLDLDDFESYFIYGQKIHKSRVLAMRGKKAPSYIRRQLKGWGLSVAESMIRDMNNYLKTDDVLYEILDESKLDIYYIQGLANKLLQVGGTAAIQSRLQVANEIKNYLNALLLDANDKYEQKTLTFSGLAEIKRENRIGIAGAVNMPVTKLFGISAAGFSSGNEDIENYNSMVESEIRTKIKRPIKYMLKLGFANLYGYVPNFEIKFPSLRELPEVDEETVKTSQTNRALALFDRGLIDGGKTVEILKKEKVITIQIEEGTIPEKPEPPNDFSSPVKAKTTI